MNEFINLKKATEELGQDFIIELTKQLLDADKKASGDLLRSLDYEVIEVVGKLMIRLKANSYILVVDGGRRPGAKQPPTSPIKKWIDIKGIKGRDKKGRFIKTSLIMSGFVATPVVLQSDVANTSRKFTVLSSAVMSVGYTNVTDIDSSSGQRIYLLMTITGTFTRTSNWSLLNIPKYSTFDRSRRNIIKHF